MNLVIEQLESRVLLSGTLPAAVHASTDAVYSVTGDPTSGYAVTLSAGTYSFDANEGAPAGDWPNLSLTLTGTALVSFNAPQTFTALTLSGTAKAAVSSSGGGISGNLLDIAAGGFSMALDPVSGNPTATLDMMDNDMILRGAGVAEQPVLRALLKSGRAPGATGLRSSDAAPSSNPLKTALGYGVVGAGAHFSPFDGQPVLSGDLLVKYTLEGDTDLDGYVRNADFARLSNAFGLNAGNQTWTSGDFNYDGSTTNGDFQLLSNDFGQDMMGPSFARTLLPVGLAVTATEGQPLTGVELATFTDTHNATSQVTQASDYTASVSWGDGVFSPTNVTVTADTDPSDPNGFVVTASSTGPITNPDELIATQIQYASTSSYHGRPASLGEPVVSITPAVAGLYAVPVSVSQMNLYWTLNANNATAIEVARSDDGGAYATLVATAGGSATMFTDTTVSEGHTYSYEIRAVQPIGDSAYSDPAVATTLAVQGLVATAASTTEIDLSWLNLSSDPAATVDVQRAPFGSSTFTTIAAGLAAGTSGYSDLSGLSEGTHWTYQVLLHEPGMGNLATLSDPADTWTLPAGPINLAATPTSNGEVDLSWTDNSAGSPRFFIYRSDNGEPFIGVDSVDPGTTTYSDTGVTDGAAYQYEVVAVNDGGLSDTSSDASIVTLPLAPSGVIATAVSATEIDLLWQNNSVGATGLTIYRSTNDANHFNALVSISDPSVNTYADATAVAGAHYYYQIKATNADLGVTSVASNQTDDTTIPATPTGLVVTHASTVELDLNWNTVAGATGYQIEREALGGAWATLSAPDPTATSYNDSALWDGVQYSYRVSAMNAAGVSAPTDSVSATTPQSVPAAPSNLQAVTLSSSAVQLVWTNNANNETSFAIDTSADRDTWTQVGSTDPGTTTFTYGGQSPGATLSYRVRAVNSVGDAASYSASATTSPAPEPALLPPAPPGDLPVFAWTHGGNVTVSWDAPLVSYDSQHLPAGFNVYAYRMTGGVGTLVAQTSVTGAATGSATITGLTADYGVYNFAVTAYNAAGESDPTYIGLQGLFADTISAPATLSASVSGTTVNYTWTDPEPPTDGNTVAPFLEYSTDGANWLGVTSSAGLAAGTLTMPPGCDCYLRLYRYHTDGTVSDYSNVVHVAAATPLAAPSSLTATPAEGGVQLDWTAGDPADYRQMLERSDDGGASFHLIAQPSGTSYLDNSADPGTTYEYRLRDALFPEFSFDYSIPLPGYSSYSDAVTATALAAPVGVTGLLSAAELGPDGQPQDGYFAFTRSTGLDRAETVSYSVDGSASDAATPGVEYQALSGTVTFAAGRSGAVLAVAPREISLVEGTKSVTLAVLAGGATSSSTINIVNTDDETLTLSGPDLTVGEVDPVFATARNHYGRPAITYLSIVQYDSAFATPLEPTVQTDASGTAQLEFTALKSGDSAEPLVVAAAAPAADPGTAPAVEAQKPLKSADANFTITASKSSLAPGFKGDAPEKIVFVVKRDKVAADETITFDTDTHSGDGRASLDKNSLTLDKNTRQAQITLTVTGGAASSKPSDVDLSVKHGNVVLTTLPITVTQPTHYTSSISVQLAVNNPTIGGDGDLLWREEAILTVLDQFGNPLSSAWKGSKLEEGQVQLIPIIAENVGYTADLNAQNVQWFNIAIPGAPPNLIDSRGETIDPLGMNTLNMSKERLDQVIKGTFKYKDQVNYLFRYQVIPANAGDPVALAGFTVRTYSVENVRCAFLDRIVEAKDVPGILKSLVRGNFG